MDSNVTLTLFSDSFKASYLVNSWQIVSFILGSLIRPRSFPSFLATAKIESIPFAIASVRFSNCLLYLIGQGIWSSNRSTDYASNVLSGVAPNAASASAWNWWCIYWYIINWYDKPNQTLQNTFGKMAFARKWSKQAEDSLPFFKSLLMKLTSCSK